MSNVGYILGIIYFGHGHAILEGSIVIEIQVDRLLEEQKRSFYWLSKETGISHTTLWRLKKGKALGINFITLEKICRVLNCQPGDVLRLAGEKKPTGRRAPRTKA
jgi:putative transcriptional regulator